MVFRLSWIGLLALLILAPQGARAVPFDLIVLSEITVNTDNFGTGFNGGWGWIVATDQTITAADIQGMTHSLTSITAPVTATSVVFNQSSTGPLVSGEAAGGSVSNSTALFSALLDPGESRVSTTAFLNAGVDYPNQFSGTATLNGSYTIGAHTASYSVLVHLDPASSTTLDAAQRISAVPEPSTALLLAFGLAGLVVGRRQGLQ